VSIAIDWVEMRPSPIAALSSQRRSALTEHACSSAPAGIAVAPSTSLSVFGSVVSSSLFPELFPEKPGHVVGIR
jgi:hypothetical protein